MEGTATDVQAAPSSAETPVAPVGEPQHLEEGNQTAGEGVKAPEAQQERQIPYDRFQEVNNKAKVAAERAEAAERELAELREQASQGKQADDDEPNIEPDTDKLLQSWARKNGLVTQKELERERLQLQAEADIRELKTKYSDFDQGKVTEFAKERGLMLANKAGLESVYNMMKASNVDPAKQEEDLRNKIIAELTESGQIKGMNAEKPGAGGARLTKTEQPAGLRGRIAQAASKYRS